MTKEMGFIMPRHTDSVMKESKEIGSEILKGKNKVGKITVNHSEQEEVVVEPPRGWLALRLRELWTFRELLYFFTWRDIKVRYKQTVLGATWAILQPVLTMVVFNVVFNKVAKVAPPEGIPYPIFSYA